MFKKLKTALILFLLCYAGLSISTPDKVAESKKPQVMIIQNVEHEALNRARQGIIDELEQANVKVSFDSAQGNPTLALQIAQKYVGSSPAVMVGIGTTSTQALMAADQKRHIPIVFSSVTDPKSAKLVIDLKKPEGSITGISDFVDAGIQFELFKKIVPSLSSIGIIYSPGEPNSTANNDHMKKVAPEKNIQLVFATANTSAEVAQATRQLISQHVQAIYINSDNVALSAFDAIVKIATENKIPVFCSDTDMVEHGALAALGPNQYDIGKQVGKMVLKIIQGEKIASIPVAYPDKTEVYLNAKQAALLNINFSTILVSEAAKVIR